MKVANSHSNRDKMPLTFTRGGEKTSCGGSRIRGKSTRGRLGTARHSATPEAEVQVAVPIGDDIGEVIIDLELTVLDFARTDFYRAFSTCCCRRGHS